MKILLAHSDPKMPARQSVDLWRVIRPFKELAKHIDWQIDHQTYVIDPSLIDTNNQVETPKLLKEIDRLKDYDIIWSSYFPDAVLFDVMTFMHEKYGTKFVLDVDDDMFHIPSDNGVWKSIGREGVADLQWTVKEAPYLVTTTEQLQKEFKLHRVNPTYVFPNYVNDDYTHKPFDNGDKVVISFFGSVTHKSDFENTGLTDALKQLMRKYKNVHVGSVGLEIEGLPKARYTFHPGKPGQDWLNEVWPNINCDIAVAPLVDNQFNRCKSNIKWLETALIPAAFVGSNVYPYKGTVEHGKTGILTDNSTEGWYEALEQLVLDKQLRTTLAANARKEVISKWHFNTKWQQLKQLVEDIYADNPTRRTSIILQA